MADVADARVDVVFPLAGRSLPRDHRHLLAEAVHACVPWLADEPGCGIHPVNLVHGGGEPALLSQRARLVLRVPRQRVGDLRALAGRTLDLAGHAVRLGEPHARDLLPHNTLYAHLVVTTTLNPQGDDEAAFLAAAQSELAELGVRSPAICGRRQCIRSADDAAAAPLTGFSLMLHGLAPDQARRVLDTGVGQHRRLGCGIFVAHRSAAAVGT